MRSAAPAAGRIFMFGAEDSDHTTLRPGLPRKSQWRAERRRRQWLQLGFYGQRYWWHELEFRCDMDRPQLLEQPCLRFSVALPLGINGRTASFNANLYPNLKPRQPVKRPATRPGLPPQHLRCVERRRQLRIQLGLCDQRHKRRLPEFQHNRTHSQLHDRPRPRFSVALPLGINAAGPRGARGRRP